MKHSVDRSSTHHRHSSRSRKRSRWWAIGLTAFFASCFSQDIRLLGPGTPGTGGGGGSGNTGPLRLSVSPTSATLTIGSTAQLVLRLVDTAGQVQPLGNVTWTSSNPTRASVNQTGFVQALAVGSTTVTGATAGLAATVPITVVNAPVGSVTVSPASATLQLGTLGQFTAVVRDLAGVALTGRIVTWSSSAPTVLSVNPSSGEVTAVAVGTATVTATCEGQNGTASVTVEYVPVATVQVTPPAATLVIGGQTQLTATPRDAGGNPLTGRQLQWSSNAPATARVSGNGLIDGLVAGSATITATSEGQSGTATITVIPPPVATVTVVPQSVTVVVGGTTNFSATPRDINGNPLVGRLVTWATANPTIVGVSQTGVVSGLAPGTALISATSEGVTGSALVTVTTAPATLVRVILSPATAALLSGQTQAFTLAGRLSDSSTIAVTGAFLASAGTINAAGIYTAPDLSGTFQVIGTALGSSLADTSSVTVTRPPVATVVLSPATATVNIGATLQLSATLRDAAGNVLTNRTVSWSSSNPALATVTNGQVRGVAAGAVTITALSEGQTGTAAITIQVPPVATVAVSPSAATVEAGATIQLTVTLRDANGTILTGRLVTWASGSPNATVSTSGLVLGVTPGSATITATSEGRSGTAAVTVVLTPVATVTLSPVNAAVAVNGTQQFTATLRDATGSVLTGRPITWSSFAPAIASVDSSTGLARGLVDGATTIAATAETKLGTASLLVGTPAPGAVADPSRLPVALAGQAPNLAAYNALNVASRSAGFSYNDPTTGVTIYKISDSRTPVVNDLVAPDYAEGGPHISLPWTGTGGRVMYTLHVISVFGDGYFVDFDYTNRTSANWRRAPANELQGGFSTNPATPRIYYYVASGNGFNRYDTATNQDANTGNFPSGNLFGASVQAWFMHDNNDAWFMAMNYSSGTVVFWNALTDQAWNLGRVADEPKMTRSGTVTAIKLHSTGNVDQCNLATGVCVNIQANYISDYASSHETGAGPYFVATDPSIAGGPKEFYYDPTTRVRTYLGDPLEVCVSHHSGQWVVGNGNGVGQWILGSGVGCSGPNEKLFEGIGFYQLSDAGLSSVRLLAHHYSKTDVYFAQPHATISPDGKLVMWGTDMNVQGGDIAAFLAIVPTR